MTLRTALLVIGGLVLVTGLVIGIVLVSQRQLFSNKAAVPSGGSATFSLTPATANITTGESITVTGVLNTGSVSTSGYTIKGSISYTGTTAPVDIVDSSGNPTNTITNLLTTDLSNCLENSVTRTAGTITFLITCATPPSNNAGYSTNGQDVNALSFTLLGITAGESISVVFDNAVSKVNDIATATDTLNFPTGGTYTVVAAGSPTPTLTPVPGASPTPTSTPVPGASPTPTATVAPASPSNTPTPTTSSSSSGTNSCGGTCGSNANCNSDLFCDTVSGTCRNAQCPTSTNCVCGTGATTPTATPTSATATTSRPTQLAQSGTASTTLLFVGLGILLISASVILLF